MGSSFPARHRLLSSGQFNTVLAGPARSTDRYFTVLARPNDVLVPRLGLAISRRSAKRAVDRNRLKRLARESFRQQRQLPAVDFVVMAKPGASAAAKPTLRDSLDNHFKRLRDRGR